MNSQFEHLFHQETPDRPTALRREREKQAHRAAMLQAAEAVFAERGFERATVEEVAQRAQFSVGALYNFFASKEDLFREVITALANDFYSAFQSEAARHSSPLDAIRAIVRLHFEYIEKHRAFLRVLVEMKPTGRICPDSVIPEVCRAIYDQYVEGMARLFAQAMDRGEIARNDPLYAALALEGVMHAFAVFWHYRHQEVPLDEKVKWVEQSYLVPLANAAGRGS